MAEAVTGTGTRPASSTARRVPSFGVRGPARAVARAQAWGRLAAGAVVRVLPRSQWRRQALTVAGLALVVAVFLVYAAERHGFFDLDVYHGAINYWVHDGGTLYDFVKPFSTYGFTYPPFAALTMLPMAVTPWPVAIVLACTACAVVSAVVVSWFVDPMARRHGWTRWYACAIGFCLAAAFEPLRETFLFGQVNMFLVFLVAADLLLLTGRGSRLGGIGIGLATAVKLTPGLFIVYLVVTGRWRAALVASGTAAVATIGAGAVAPDASRVFWTEALWNTDRIGTVTFVSNQSLHGAVARLHPDDPSTTLWLVAVVAVLAWWVVRVRRTAAAGDEMTGFALTGVAGCLVSPITWIHHLVWVGPALLLMVDSALAADRPRRRRYLLTVAVASYVVLCSRFVWDYHDAFYTPVSWLFSNAYLWVSLVVFLVLPVRESRGRVTTTAAVAAQSRRPADHDDFDGRLDGHGVNAGPNGRSLAGVPVPGTSVWRPPSPAPVSPVPAAAPAAAPTSATVGVPSPARVTAAPLPEALRRRV